MAKINSEVNFKFYDEDKVRISGETILETFIFQKLPFC